MTEEQVVNNMHLAVFQGWEFVNDAPEDYPSGYYVFENEDEKHIAETVKQMNFHDSWDWLIPVYNQAVELFEDKKGFPQFENDAEFKLAKFGLKTALAVSAVNKQLNISSAYLKISDFVKWYHKVLNSNLIQ